ncbi:MAG: 23S rRNA (uracil-C(5))-methyltransferase RlmCD [Desulfovibrio sp.]
MPDDICILTPHDLAVTGKSVARLNGMAVFLDKGLPGETVRARITARKKRFAEGVVLETLTPSPDERPSFCAYGGICGGCAWTTLAYEAECAWKERQVMETLRRIGKVTVAEYLPFQPSPRPLGYRNKMEFAFGPADDGSPALGLRKRGEHTVVPVEDCPLHAHSLRSILQIARDWLREHALSVWRGNDGFCRFLVVRSPDYAPGGKKHCLVECITAPGTKRETEAVRLLGQALHDAGATGFAHSVRKSRGNVAYGESLLYTEGETTVTERVGDLTLTAPLQAFLQANTAAATLLYDRVRVYAGPSPGVVWDLYCGVGGIGLYLANTPILPDFPGGITLRGIETVPEAIRFAEINAKQITGDIAFVHGDAASAFAKLSPRPDLVITDPPRAGMGENLVRLLLREKPRRIISVSCDTASFARDLSLLSEAYAVKTVQAFDLFPKTPHIETVSLLERRN